MDIAVMITLVTGAIFSLLVLLPAIITYIVLKHRREMILRKEASLREHSEINRLSRDYEEFVLGVDSRMRRLEERLLNLESKLSQTMSSSEVQNIHRS